MNSDKRKDYYVGLDMGTGSLGRLSENSDNLI